MNQSATHSRPLINVTLAVSTEDARKASTAIAMAPFSRISDEEVAKHIVILRAYAVQCNPSIAPAMRLAPCEAASASATVSRLIQQASSGDHLECMTALVVACSLGSHSPLI
jgi:hypothetical protein